MVFSATLKQYFSYIAWVSLIGRRNQSPQRKPQCKYNTRLVSKIFQSFPSEFFIFKCITHAQVDMAT